MPASSTEMFCALASALISAFFCVAIWPAATAASLAALLAMSRSSSASAARSFCRAWAFAAVSVYCVALAEAARKRSYLASMESPALSTTP